MTIHQEGSTRVDGAPAVDVTPRPLAPVRDEAVASPVVEEHPSLEVKTGSRRDRVGWGAVWAGTLTTIATFLLLELAFFSLGWLTLNAGDGPGPSTSVTWMTGLAGLLAFLLGGITAAASSRLRGVSDGLLHGVLVWALSVTGILLLTLLGGGALFGAFSNVLGQLSVIQNAIGSGNVQLAGAEAQARNVAQSAVLALGAFITAAAIGGAIGAKMWPGKENEQEHMKSIDLP